MGSPNHCIIVCGHAIWTGGIPQKGYDESEWLIESYKSGETPTFIEHIKAGVKALGDDPHAALVFSGGPTRSETQLSEARSYANLAAANNYFGLLPPVYDPSSVKPSSDPFSPIPIDPRILLEERALDSYHNIIFSLILFWRTYGSWPSRLTIVSHAFKRARLVDAHCGAIGFPLEKITFIGINPPNLPADLAAAGDGSYTGADDSEAGGEVSPEKAAAMQGAREIVGLWADDPHGIGEVLARKRQARNPWNVNQKLFASGDEREKSGVRTLGYENMMEALMEGSPRPWNPEYRYTAPVYQATWERKMATNK